MPRKTSSPSIYYILDWIGVCYSLKADVKYKSCREGINLPTEGQGTRKIPHEKQKADNLCLLDLYPKITILP